MLKYFTALSLVFCIIIFSNCTNRSQKGANHQQWLDKAQIQLNYHPDSALWLIDTVLGQVDEDKIKAPNLLEILALKQKAFSKLQLMDSFFVTGEKIREVASTIPDSLAMAETLVQLYGDVDFKHIKKAEAFMPGAIAAFTQN